MSDAFVRAALELLAFVEISDESVVDPDSAVRALEDFYAALTSCAPDELLSYATVADALEAEAIAEGSERRAESFHAAANELRQRASHRRHTP